MIEGLYFKYDGAFEDGVASGRGTYTSNPLYLSPGALYRYDGCFSHNCPNGTGSAWYLPGNGNGVIHYCGGWELGKWSGCGTVRLADGSQWNGNFRDDQLEGNYMITWANGRREYRYVM
jgi:hypothetical protein